MANLHRNYCTFKSRHINFGYYLFRLCRQPVWNGSKNETDDERWRWRWRSPKSRNCVKPDRVHGRSRRSREFPRALWQSRKTNQIHKQATGLRTDREREIDNCCLVALTKLFTDPIRMRIPERNPPIPRRQSSFCCCALIANLAHALATATNKSPPLFFMYLFIYFLFINENYPRHRITNNFRFAVPKVERDGLIHLFTIGPKRGPFHNWISVNCDSTFVYFRIVIVLLFYFLWNPRHLQGAHKSPRLTIVGRHLRNSRSSQRVPIPMWEIPIRLRNVLVLNAH